MLLIPGYCMNTTPLVYHPNGPSLVEFLAEDGIEVWTANLRGQGDTRSIGGQRNVGFEKLALVDLATAVDAVLDRTTTGADRVDLVGCSLGGTFCYTYLAHRPDAPVGALVGMGAPLRWTKRHPFLALACAAPRLVGAVRVVGTRSAARRMLPLASRFSRLMGIYMNTAHVDLSDPERLVETVEDPIPRLNEQIARWIGGVDLVVEGVNVTDAIRRIERPILSIYANRDGIVPPHAATAVAEVTDGRADLLPVGDDETWYAHTDLFVGRTSQDVVFAPLSGWLRSAGRR